MVKNGDAPLGNDLLYQTDNGYVVYDRFFGLWLAKK